MLALLPATASAQRGGSPPPVVEPPPPGTQTVTPGFDLAHTFYSAEPAARPPLGLAWRADLETSYPVVAGGLVYLQGNSVVRVFDVATGQPRFDAQTGDGTDGVPAIAGDRLYVLGPCRAHAFDRRSGAPIWALDDQGCTGGGGYRASLHGRRVTGGEYFLEAETGARIPGRAAPDVIAGDVGLAREGMALVARELGGGAELWRVTLPDTFSGTSGALAAAGEAVLWRAGDRLYTLDRRSGREIWSGRLEGAGGHIGHGGIDHGSSTRKRYVRLGAGRLAGRAGRYRATFGIRTVARLRRGEFVALCVRGIHRHGMSYGDRLDRGCGARSVRF